MAASNSGSLLPNPETLVAPEGPVPMDEEAAELLAEFPESLTGYGDEETEGIIDTDAAYHERMEHFRHLPWWKRPSPWWQLALLPILTIPMTATMAPRIAIYTQLACSVHRPDISSSQPGFLLSMLGKLVEGAGDDCASDPVVQAAVAKLTAVIVTTNGILCCLTTGWWGSLSDRHGRLKIMGISIIGTFITDASLIFTTLNVSRLPGGYWFILVGSSMDGLLGTIITSQAASTAYLSDVTSEADRSRILSLSVGLIFCGLAIGPSLGSLLVRFTKNTLSVFYVSASLQLFFIFLILFVLPESLLPSQIEQARERYGRDMERAKDGAGDGNGLRGFVTRARKFLLGVVRPLTVFVEDERKTGMGKERKDYNLLLLITAYGIALSVMGAYTYKFQYAQATFKWGPEEIGYWLSLIGITRGIFATIILPVIIKIFKPKPYIIEIPNPRFRTQHDSHPSSSSSSSETQPLLLSSSSEPATIKKELHSPSFDMSLCRVSLFIELIGYTLLALLSDNPKAFGVAGILGAFGSGFSPALQSVGVGMYMRKGGVETGRLFGALSLVQSLSSQIISPAIYGIIYMATVRTHPQTIFYVSVLTVLCAFMCLAFVRVPKVGEEEGDRMRRRFVEDGLEADDASILIEDRRTRRVSGATTRST